MCIFTYVCVCPQFAPAAIEASPRQLEGSAEEPPTAVALEVDESSPGEELQKLTKETREAAAVPAGAPKAQAVILEGALGRKHELEATGKKASNRSEFRFYCSFP